MRPEPYDEKMDKLAEKESMAIEEGFLEPQRYLYEYIVATCPHCGGRTELLYGKYRIHYRKYWWPYKEEA